jgi:UDP-N-acetylmuramoyl-L-alanyl-D-glutamate--2,6-diaminopimelate ligase
MKLENLLHNISVLELKGDPEIEITSVVTNSQQVTSGSLFIALKGSILDGHMYVGEAITKGAVAVMVERPMDLGKGCASILVENTQTAQAIIGKNFYADPASKLKMIGVTGTKGKTTTTFLIRSLLEEAGFKTGLIGTIYNIVNEQRLSTRNTTPASLELQHLLAEMVKVETEYVVMEVSLFQEGFLPIFLEITLIFIRLLKSTLR